MNVTMSNLDKKRNQRILKNDSYINDYRLNNPDPIHTSLPFLINMVHNMPHLVHFCKMRTFNHS